MDKKLLDSLNNLSVALENIADTLKEKKSKSATGAALESGNFSKSLQEISASVKTIKKDTEEILKNQRTILEISKKKESDKKTETFESDPKKEGMIKKGVSTILLIAVAVLAIGLAFKIVGHIDFLSVISLSLAIVMISVAFEKVAKLDLTIKQAAIASTTMIMMAMAITMSSWALSMMTSISPTQALTAIFIGAAFAVLGFSMKKIMSAVGEIKNPALILLLPLVLPAMALGIALSSWAFHLVKPISFSQFLTTVFIAATFAVISFGIRNMLRAFKGMSNKDLLEAVIFLPLILPAIALGIALSSYILAKTSPIPFETLFKITLFGIALSIIVTAISIPIRILGKMSTKDLLLGSLGIVIVATAVMMSSLILGFGDYKKYPDWKWALGVGLSLLMFTPAIVALGIISMTGLGMVAIVAGAAMTLVVAASIVATSYILGKGKYEKYPTFAWILGTGLAMTGFGVAVLTLGIMAITGIGYLAILAGTSMVTLIAESIVSTADILGKGKYEKYPSYAWAFGVGLVMTAFGFAVLTLGTFVVATFGLGWLALEAGSSATLLIADTIVKASDILRKGNYTGGPTKEWAEGISLSIGAFSPVYGMLMASGILSLFGVGGVSPDDFSTAIRTISNGIVDAAKYFAGANVAFQGGPKKEWAEGVGLAIGAFSPVYKVLADNSGLFASGVSPKHMKAAIMTISEGIVDAAGYFNSSKNTGVFDASKVPSEKWGKGVGNALTAFAPVFKALSEDSGMFTSGNQVLANMVNGIGWITQAIIVSAANFSTYEKKSGGKSWGSYPTEDWAKGVGTSIEAFTGIISTMKDDLGDDIPEFFDNVTIGMVKISLAYDRLALAIRGFSNSLKGIDEVKISLFKGLTGNLAILSALDSTMFNNMMNVLESRAGVFANLIKDNNKLSASTMPNVKIGGGAAIQSIRKDEFQAKDSKGETNLQKLDKVILLLSNINNEVKGLDEYLNKANPNPEIGKES